MNFELVLTRNQLGFVGNEMFSDENLEELVRYVRDGPLEIEKLDFTACPGFNPAPLRDILSLSIVTLDISGTFDVKFVVDCLVDPRCTLRELFLTGLAWTLNEQVQFCHALQDPNCHLHTLILREPRIDRGEFSVFCQMIVRRGHLSSLSIQKANMDDERLSYLCWAFSENKTITHLDLQYNTFHSVFYLSSLLLERNDTLCEINLQNNDVPYAIESFVPIVANNHCIENISLSNEGPAILQLCAYFHRNKLRKRMIKARIMSLYKDVESTSALYHYLKKKL